MLVVTGTDQSGSIPRLSGLSPWRSVAIVQNCFQRCIAVVSGGEIRRGIPSAIVRKAARHMGPLSGETGSAAAVNFISPDCAFWSADVLLRSCVYA